VRHFEAIDLYTGSGLAVGAAFAVGAWGLFLDKRWGRISVGCLMVLVVLWCADMLLFIAFRGLDAGRGYLLGVVVGLVIASICTWSVLAARSPGFE
jgi:hypothetical protein